MYVYALPFTIVCMTIRTYTTVQANNLHWKCLSRLPLIYNTPLWAVMQGVLDVIISGVRVSI